MTVRKRKEPRTAGLDENGYTKSEEWLVENEEGITTPEAALTATGLPERGDEHDDLDMVVKRLNSRMMEDDENRWLVVVEYERPDSNPTSNQNASGLSSTSFDTGAAIVHKIQAVTETPQAKSFAKAGNAPLSRGLIGWDGEKAQGVDIQTGAFALSVTRRYSLAEMTQAYVLNLSKNSNVVNSDDWGPWDAGEVLFKGATGRFSSGGQTEIKGDTARQFADADGITGVTSENSDNGILYLKLTKIPNLANYQVQLYKNNNFSEANLVAEDPLATIGNVGFASVGGSGVSGTINFLSYEYDTQAVVIEFPFPWELTYNVQISENQETVTVGEIDVTDKLGWEYLDVQYSPEEQTVDAKKRIVQAANYAYLHQVYKEAVFATLLNLLDEDDILPT